MTTSSSATATSDRLDPALAAGNRRPLASYAAKHFAWTVSEEGVGRITLSRPERKNPLTFDSYAELRELFAGLDSKTVQQLYTQLGALRVQLVRNEPSPEEKR